MLNRERFINKLCFKIIINMGLFDNVLLRFQDLGVFTVLFPAVLIFLLSYAALMRAHLFHQTNNENGFAALTSVIIAFVLVTQTFLVNWMLTILKGSFLLVIGLFIFLILGFAGLGISTDPKKPWSAASIVALVAMVLGLLFFGWPFIVRSLGISGISGVLSNSDLWAFIILVAIAWGIWAMIKGRPGAGGGGGGEPPKKS